MQFSELHRKRAFVTRQDFWPCLVGERTPALGDMEALWDCPATSHFLLSTTLISFEFWIIN